MINETIRQATRHLPRHKAYLRDALHLVSLLQPFAWANRYHVTLGGGMLNHGYSDKDIDLYLLPFEQHNNNIEKLKLALKMVLGEVVTDYKVTEKDYPPSNSIVLANKFVVGGVPVDVFVVGR